MNNFKSCILFCEPPAFGPVVALGSHSELIIRKPQTLSSPGSHLSQHFYCKATKFLSSLLVLQTPFWNTRTRPSSLRINQTSAHSPPLSCLDAHFIVWFAICWTLAHHFQFLPSKSPATNKKLSALCWLNLKLLKMNAKKVTTCKHTVIHCFSPFCLYTDPFLVCGSVPCCVKGGF